MISVERRGRVMVATLSRPPVNALNGELIVAIGGVVDQAVADPDIAVLHFRSDQKVFSAGGDVALMKSLMGTPDGPERLVGAVVRPLQQLYDRIESAPLVTIAEISGHALGGGLELALACDFRVAAEEVQIGLVEVKLGLLAAAGGTQRLTHLCGRGVAKRLLMCGEAVSGKEAAALGIVQWALPAPEVAAFAIRLAEECAALPRLAVVGVKHCIRAAETPAADGSAEEAEWSRRLYGDPETSERVGAFLARRK